MKTKHKYYATANTGKGFVSFLADINEKNNKEFIYILKGGSGCGKSTLMKKIADYFSKQNNIEYFFCSTDCESLDGVRIVDKNISIVDGTAPHVIDAKLPCVNSKLVDLGVFIGDLSFQETYLKDCLNKKMFYFDLVYKYLEIAKILQDINIEIFKQEISMGRINKLAKKIVSDFNTNSKEKHVPRKLFLNSLAEINKNYFENNNFDSLFFNTSKEESFYVFKSIEQQLKCKNIHYDIIANYLNPELIDAIIIENKIIISNNTNNIKINKKIEKNNKLIKKIINLAKMNLFYAKRYHNNIENVYVNHVDFDGVEKITNQIIAEIQSR